jgi:hypothetical protein
VALDSKTKRGSAPTLGLPFRPWIGEPDGTIDATDRAGVAKLSASIAPASPSAVSRRSDNMMLRPGLGI